MKWKNISVSTSDMFFMFYWEQNMGLWDLEIIAFCFYLCFIQHHNFFGIGVGLFLHTLYFWLSNVKIHLKLHSPTFMTSLGLDDFYFVIIDKALEWEVCALSFPHCTENIVAWLKTTILITSAPSKSLESSSKKQSVGWFHSCHSHFY